VGIGATVGPVAAGAKAGFWTGTALDASQGAAQFTASE